MLSILKCLNKNNNFYWACTGISSQFSVVFKVIFVVYIRASLSNGSPDSKIYIYIYISVLLAKHFNVFLMCFSPWRSKLFGFFCQTENLVQLRTNRNHYSWKDKMFWENSKYFRNDACFHILKWNNVVVITAWGSWNSLNP